MSNPLDSPYHATPALPFDLFVLPGSQWVSVNLKSSDTLLKLVDSVSPDASVPSVFVLKEFALIHAETS